MCRSPITVPSGVRAVTSSSAGSDASSTASEAAPSVSAVRAGDYLTVDVDSVGSVEPGADLTVFVRYRIA